MSKLVLFLLVTNTPPMQTPHPVCSLISWWALGWAHPIAWVMLLWTFRYTLCGHSIFGFLGPISRGRIAGASNDCNAWKEPGLKLPLDRFVFWIQGLTLSKGRRCKCCSFLPRLFTAVPACRELCLIDFGFVIICESEADIVRVYTARFPEFLPCALG